MGLKGHLQDTNNIVAPFFFTNSHMIAIKISGFWRAIKVGGYNPPRYHRYCSRAVETTTSPAIDRGSEPRCSVARSERMWPSQMRTSVRLALPKLPSETGELVRWNRTWTSASDMLDFRIGKRGLQSSTVSITLLYPKPTSLPLEFPFRPIFVQGPE